MKNVLIGVFALLAIGVTALLGAAAMQPDVITVERSAVIDAQPQDIWIHVADYENFVAWSPWTAMDPSATREISTPSYGMGSTYAWSGNDEVGTGSMETTVYEEPTRMEQTLTFTAPWESQSTVFYELTPVDGGTQVRWGFEENPNFQMKMATLFMDMDEMLGGQYEQGLANLKVKAEETAQGRIEAEEEILRLAAEGGQEEPG